MTSRERLTATLNHRIPDRVPMVDISFWPETLERWRKEGMPDGVSPDEYFGLDTIARVAFDGSFQLPSETLEESENWRIRRDANGVTIKEWKDWRISYSPPVRLDSVLKTWDDWLPLKEKLTVDPARIGEAMEKHYANWRARDLFVVVSPVEPMWFLIEHATGFETGLPMLAEQPDLAADVLNTYTDFTLGMCDLCRERGMTFDGLWFFSDLCYKNGMLFSPQCYRDLLMPCHRRIKAWCDAQGIPFMLHCDGDMRQFIPLLIEVGFDCVQPLGARCGNDVRDLKRRHGTDIVFFGNISADVMGSERQEDIFEEVFTKVTAAKAGGGYIYHSDHSIPPLVSLENYRYVIELVKSVGNYE